MPKGVLISHVIGVERLRSIRNMHTFMISVILSDLET